MRRAQGRIGDDRDERVFVVARRSRASSSASALARATTAGGAVSSGVRRRPMRRRPRPIHNWPLAQDSGIDRMRPAMVGDIHSTSEGEMQRRREQRDDAEQPRASDGGARCW